MIGNRNSATELSTNTVPSDTDISSASAFIAGPTAPMADPPQIAVPDEISVDVRLATPSNFPTKYPSISVPNIVAIVNTIPCFPARYTEPRSIPNPSSTTDACSRYFVNLPSSCGNGLPIVNASTSPKARATGGEPHGLRQNSISIIKRAFCHIKSFFGCRSPRVSKGVTSNMSVTPLLTRGLLQYFHLNAKCQIPCGANPSSVRADLCGSFFLRRLRAKTNRRALFA